VWHSWAKKELHPNRIEQSSPQVALDPMSQLTLSCPGLEDAKHWQSMEEDQIWSCIKQVNLIYGCRGQALGWMVLYTTGQHPNRLSPTQRSERLCRLADWFKSEEGQSCAANNHSNDLRKQYGDLCLRAFQ